MSVDYIFCKLNGHGYDFYEVHHRKKWFWNAPTSNTFSVGVRNICTSKSHIELPFLCYFPTTLQLHNSPCDGAGELFKPSKDVANLLDCTEKIGKLWISFFFVADAISGLGFRPFWLRLPCSGPQLLEGSLWLKFLLATRSESESFQPLIGFLAFLVQMLWSESKKKWISKGSINNFVYRLTMKCLLDKLGQMASVHRSEWLAVVSQDKKSYCDCETMFGAVSKEIRKTWVPWDRSFKEFTVVVWFISRMSILYCSNALLSNTSIVTSWSQAHLPFCRPPLSWTFSRPIIFGLVSVGINKIRQGLC